MSSFVNYIDQLEKDLPPISEDLKRLRIMCAFQPEMEPAIEQRSDIPDTREDLITLAINIEGAFKGSRSSNPSSSFTQAAPSTCTGGSFKNKGKAKAGYKGKEEPKRKGRQGSHKEAPRTEKPTTTADGKPICFNCNKPGHISRSYPKPKKDGKKVSHLKVTAHKKEDKKSVSINAILHRRKERHEEKPYC